MCPIKSLPCVDTTYTQANANLMNDYYIRTEDGLEIFKTYKLSDWINKTGS